MAKIQRCNVCGKDNLTELIDFGAQNICHHFLKSPMEQESFHRLVLGQCGLCGIVQLTERMPIDEMKPRYDWLTCNEPEAHLDRLVKTISQLPGITKDSKICGISFKDDSTLDRFKKSGFNNTWRADTRSDLGIRDPIVGFQSVQENFNPQSVNCIIKNHGIVDVFIARHIIEHAYDLQEFIESSKKIVNSEGYLVFEIPDCQRAFERCDYTTIWEEHTIYFTGETFRNLFNLNGLSLIYFEKMSYAIEDCYVGIAKIDGTRHASLLSQEVLEEQIQRDKRFAEQYPNVKNRLKQFFADYHHNHGKVVLFGGGHMSCTFLNLFELKDFIEFIVDDNPNMRGLYMPGSRLPILESKAMYENDIKLCVLTLSLSSEEKVIQNNQKFFERGGEFISIFPGSRWSRGLVAK